MKKMLILLILLLPVSSLFAQWEPVFFDDAGGIYSASSELEKPSELMDIGRYSPWNLFDGDPATSWVEGEEGPGIGSYVLVGIPGPFMQYLIIHNGYQESESLFIKNNRVKELRVSIFAGFTFDGREGQTGFDADLLSMDESAIITLSDEMGAQRIELPFDAGDVAAFSEEGFKYYKYDYPDETGVRDFLVLKFEIVSVYPGSIWDDTCIAGIDFSNQDQGQFPAPDEQVTNVSLESDSSRIFIETAENRKLLLVDAQTIADERGYTAQGEFLTFTLMDVSPEMQWAVISYQHGFTSGGNIEETFHLWSIPRMKEVPEALMKAYGATPFGFKSGAAGSTLKHSITHLCCLKTSILIWKADTGEALSTKISSQDSGCNQRKDCSIIRNMKMNTSDWLLLFALGFLWGGAFIFSGAALRQLPPFTIVALRVSIAAIILNIIIFVTGRRYNISLKMAGNLLLMGFINNAVPFALIVWSQTRITAGLASILNATTPIFVIILAHFFTQDEKFTLSRFIGVLIGLAGVIVLIGPGALSDSGFDPLPRLAVLGAGLAYSISGIFGKGSAGPVWIL